MCIRKKAGKITAVLIFVLFSSCEVFLGQDADTSDQGVLYSLWKTFNETHAYVEIKMDLNPKFSNWEETYLHYSDLLTAGKLSLFYACGDMLNELMDPHVILYDNKGNISMMENSYFSYSRSSGNSGSSEWRSAFTVTRDLLIDKGTIIGNDDMLYGIFTDAPHIGYLYIATFDDTFTWAKEIDTVTEFLKKNTAEIIIDVRYNSGGLIPVMEYIASRFVIVQKNYAMASTKNGTGYNDFSAPMTFKIAPAGVTYTKPVVLLTNKVSISAAEWFTLALRTQPHIKHAGTNTSGALSMRTIHPMINGWYYSISAYKVTDMKGKCYEGFGIRPDKIITGTQDAKWIINPSNQLLAVLDWMLNGCKEDEMHEQGE